MGIDALTEKLTEIIEPAMKGQGFNLVRLLYMPGTHQGTLQIMLERKDGSDVNVEECAVASRYISALLEVEDPIENAYILEVSSPGIDRPLTRLEDFARFKGFHAKVELSDPVEDRKRFQGVLLGVDGENISFQCEGKDWLLPFSKVKKARLILTDELIAHSLAQRKKSGSE